jgi:hypothetical protein
MNKEFIPYEQALELKELGFNEQCLKRYWFIEALEEKESIKLLQDLDCELKDKYFVKAPLYQQAFRWFDDNTDYIGFIVPSVEEFGFTYEIHNGFDVNVSEEEAYPFRHQAELACLKKLIEIVKNK